MRTEAGEPSAFYILVEASKRLLARGARSIDEDSGTESAGPKATAPLPALPEFDDEAQEIPSEREIAIAERASIFVCTFVFPL